MKTLIVPIVVVSMAAGFVLGRLSTPEAPPPVAKEIIRATPAIIPPSDAAAAAKDRAELATLREKAKIQEEKIRDLERQIQERPAPVKGGDAPDPMAPAVELWKIMKAGNKARPSADDRFRAMKLLGDLTPAQAAFFIERFRECRAEGQQESAVMALFMVGASGGTEASNFLAGLLSDTTVEDGIRREALRALTGTHDFAGRYVITDSLAQLVDGFQQSADATERAAAAGILGLKPKEPATEAALRRMAEDSAETVKVAAICALSRGASAETLAWIKAYRQRPELSEWTRNRIDGLIEQMEAKK